MKFYVEADGYGCSLYEGRDLADAKEKFIADVGRLGFRSIREATEEDIDWVLGMGGMIHGEEGRR